MMILESFSEANKQLIEYKPLFNKVVKAVDVFDIETSSFFTKNVNDKSILVICDFEGKIVFIDEAFSKHIFQSDVNNKSILDFLHQEDIPVVIEHLVHLLQGRSHSIAIDTRIVTSDNQNFYSKWHVGYIRGLFFFYPVELPKFIEVNSGTPNDNTPDFKSLKTFLPDQLLWKIEVSKTLYEWDALIFKQIKSCTMI